MPKKSSVPQQSQPVFKVAAYSLSPVKPLDLPKPFTNTNPLYVNVKCRVKCWR
jgi:hypothetical protein